MINYVKAFKLAKASFVEVSAADARGVVARSSVGESCINSGDQTVNVRLLRQSTDRDYFPARLHFLDCSGGRQRGVPAAQGRAFSRQATIERS